MNWVVKSEYPPPMLEQVDELSSEVKVPPMLEQVDELSSEVRVSTSNARAGWWIE